MAAGRLSNGPVWLLEVTRQARTNLCARPRARALTALLPLSVTWLRSQPLASVPPEGQGPCDRWPYVQGPTPMGRSTTTERHRQEEDRAEPCRSTATPPPERRDSQDDR